MNFWQRKKESYANEPRRKVAIIGSQGVPPQYGGFETLVDNIISRRSNDVEYTVFCSQPDMGSKLSSYKGCRLKYIPVRAHGVMSVPYDILSMIKAIRGYDAILILGVSGCLFLPVYRLFSKARIIVNIDGLEHQRDKWDKVAKRFLKFSLGSCIRWAHVIISDNKGIQNYVKEEYGREARLIAYGGDHAIRSIEKKRQDAMLDYYGLISKGYDLSICRIEPENNCALTLEAYSSCKTPLVFVGNWNNSDYSRDLYKKYKNHPNINLLRAIYDPDVLFTLRNNARRYVHGHRAGGTNPSLVEAMFFDMPIMAYDIIYNRETTHGKAWYFDSVESLKQLIERTDLNGKATNEVACKQYIWELIANQYEELFK